MEKLFTTLAYWAFSYAQGRIERTLASLECELKQVIELQASLKSVINDLESTLGIEEYKNSACNGSNACGNCRVCTKKA